MASNIKSLLNRQDQRVFVLAVFGFLCLSLLAIWYPRFPAMQDYPQHLFMAYVLSDPNSSLLNWAEYYMSEYLFGPYSLFFLIVGPLAKVIPIESAGKVFISLTLCLVAALAFAWNFSRDKEFPAWSLLMLFPLFFTQVYYMGFTNFLISIPILFLLLLLHERAVTAPVNARIAIGYLIFSGLLFLSHPYSVLVYIVLSCAISGWCRKNKEYFYVSLIGPSVMLIIFALWYVSTFNDLSVSQQGDVFFSWLSPSRLLEYLLLPFVGMRLTGGVNYVVLILWLSVAGLFLKAGYASKVAVIYRSPASVMLLSTLLGYFFLPFFLGDYSYFNLRMSLICYFLMALLLANVKFRQRARAALVSLLSMIMLLVINTQITLSAETEKLLPLLKVMKKNAAVAAIYSHASSEVIDKVYFDQFHAHDHFYYHVLVGGGVAASLFPSNFNPVNLKQNISMPDVSKNPARYRYILVRGKNAGNISLRKTHQLVVNSPPWTLFERAR